MPHRNTKIIATLGPASANEASIRVLADAGADVFRLNFSHGSHDKHRAVHAAIRRVEAALGRPLGILIDLQGPKLRLGVFASGKLHLTRGDRIHFDLDVTPGDARRVCIPHPEIIAAVRPGDTLLIDDGKMRLRVIDKLGDVVTAEALTDGVLSDRKGVNVPSVALPLSAITAKDQADLALGLSLGIDWVALSFVQRPEDLHEARALIGERAWLMAKIEKPAALTQLDAIIAAADGVMVARGDLGVELPPEAVPGLQKRIVRRCREAGKPVVVATQMLESMIEAPAPTRAEASDVATAVYDGVDAVMLSAESASGKYPREAVEMMTRIITCTESDPLQRQLMDAVHGRLEHSSTDAIGAAMRTVAGVLPLGATVAYTASGATTLRLANQRPHAPILSLTPDKRIARRLTLVWGVRSRLSRRVAPSTTDHDAAMLTEATEACRDEGLTTPSDAFVLAAGVPFGTPGSTNLLRVVLPGSAAQTPSR